MSTEATDRRVEVHPGKEAIVRFDPERTFTCVDECSWCCHHGVMLYESDFFELGDHASLADSTTTVQGQPFVRREAKDRSVHVGTDGAACHFLDGDGRCTLQAEHDWKPTRCSIFPLSISVADEDIVVDVRDDAERHCEGMDVSNRRLIDHLDAFLPPALWELDDPATLVEL